MDQDKIQAIKSIFPPVVDINKLPVSQFNKYNLSNVSDSNFNINKDLYNIA